MGVILLFPPPSTPATPPSTPPSDRFGVAMATHELVVSWDKATTNQGWFTIGTSLLGGPDLLAPASQLVPQFAGTYDNLSNLLAQAQWSRGRSSTLTDVEQGKWSGVIRDPDGRYNPANPSSPLYGDTDQPGRPLRHRAYFNGVWKPQFYGWTRTVEYEPTSRGRGLLHIEADDLFVRLDVPSPTIGSLTGTNTGTVIGALLDSIGWTDPAYRSLDLGDVISSWPGISDGSKTLLQQISEVLEVEFGLFFADGGGRAMFESRYARMTAGVDYVISEVMQKIRPGSSLDNIANRATFTKEGSTPQTYTDELSADPIFGFGLRPLPEVTSPYLANDEAAMARAQYRVSRRKDPVGDIWQLKLDNRTDELLTAVLNLEISDRVQSDEANTGTTFDGFVERLERSVTAMPYKDTASVIMSERRAQDQVFIIGTSLLSGSDVLAL